MLNITYATLEEWINLKTEGRGLNQLFFPTDMIDFLESETGLKVKLLD